MNYYEQLEIKQTAKDKDIVAAFRSKLDSVVENCKAQKLISGYKDKAYDIEQYYNNINNAKLSTNEHKKFRAAYSYLIDLNSRKSYDKILEAISKAEKTLTKEDYDTAMHLINDNFQDELIYKEEKDRLKNYLERKIKPKLGRTDSLTSKNSSADTLIGYKPKPVEEKKKSNFSYKKAVVFGVAYIIPYFISSEYNKKYRIQPGKYSFRISSLIPEEISEIDGYTEKLDNQINKLLADPKYNNYKLEILKAKLDMQDKLLEKMIAHTENERKPKSNFDLFKNKWRIAALARQRKMIETKKTKLENKTDNYTKETSLNKLNSRLAKTHAELEKATTQLANEPSDVEKEKISLRKQKLELKQSKLLTKRDKKSTKIKLRVVRNGKFYEFLNETVSFVTTIPKAFMPIPDSTSEPEITSEDERSYSR